MPPTLLVAPRPLALPGPEEKDTSRSVVRIPPAEHDDKKIRADVDDHKLGTKRFGNNTGCLQCSLSSILIDSIDSFFFPSERTDAASRTPKRGIEPQATLEPTQRVCDFAIVAVDALEPTRFG